MKIDYKKIFHVNKNWWDSFTSCFVGTLLGVFLTFGISGYLEKKEQEENERKILMISINRLDNSFRVYKQAADSLNEEQLVFTKIVKDFREKTNILTKDDFDHLYEYLFVTNELWLPFDTMTENIFNSNIEIWKTLSPVAIEYFSTVLFYHKRTADIYNKIIGLKRELLDNYITTGGKKAYKSEYEFVHSFLKNNRNCFKLEELIYEIALLNYYTTYYTDVLENLLKELNLTEEEIINFYESYENENDSIKSDTIETT